MAKDVVEDIRKLDINWLMRSGEHKAGNYYNGREVIWTRSGAFGETKNSVSYDLDLHTKENASLKLKYICTNKFSEEKARINYTIDLTTSKCFFGGHRYWFVCPKNGCSKRVGALYQGIQYFLCRHCLELTYSKRNVAKRYRLLNKLFDYEEKADELLGEISEKYGRKFYQGQPTRKFKQYLKYISGLNHCAKMWSEMDKLLIT
jgi:hypothetical protein